MSLGAALFASFFFLLVYAAVVLTLVLGIRHMREARSARYWPMIPAVLKKCEVETRSASNATVYFLSLKYTYVVAGIGYAGATLAIGAGGASNRTPADEARRSVLSMAPFMIRSNPAKPEMSAIFLSGPSETYGVIIGGIFALIITTAIALAILGMSGGLRAVGRWFS